MTQRLFLIIMILLGLCRTAVAVEILFKQQASVSGGVIRLGDIADFNENTGLTEALATISIGSAPAPGESIVLRAASVQHELLAARSVPEETSWSGSPAITVSRSAVTLGPERVMAYIADYIHDQKRNLPEADVTFVPSSLPLPFALPVGDLAVEVIPSNPGLLGSSRFSLIFRVGGEVAKNMSVRGKVEAIASIVVTSQTIRKDTVLRPELLTTAPTDISDLTAPVFEPNHLVGMKLTRSLRAGSPVLAGMVEALPVVRRGEKVKMVIDSGPLHVTATGLAYSDGKIDEMIRVQNLSSNKLIYCRVAAPGLVEVML